MPFARKTLPLICFLFLALPGLRAQSLYLKAEGSTPQETHVIDSIGYGKKHDNAKSVLDEATALEERLRAAGWLAAEKRQMAKPSDSVFAFSYSFGQKVDAIHIYIGQNGEVRGMLFPDQKGDTVRMPFIQTRAFIDRALATLEKNGFPLARLRLETIDVDGTAMRAALRIDLGKQRRVNDLVISGYDKFPESHRRQLLRLYKGKTFNRETLDKLYRDLGQFRFVTRTRYPEILFMQDTTKIYAYVEKAKANRFDGLIGFSNDDQPDGSSKVRFNGYLDLLLVNALNGGEQFSLYWKSDGRKQTTFNAETQLPYIFKSPFALKAGLNIFKQDSTYQNTRTNIGLGYLFNYDTRVFLGYEATESSDIQNANTTAVNDYKSRFGTATFEFSQYRDNDFLFPKQMQITAKAGAGSRNAKLRTDGQFYAEVNAYRNFYLNDRNSISLKTQDYVLSSNSYLISELYRFGGINSIRGFNENSLQASAVALLMGEYRYTLAPGLYVHSITDYGHFLDDSRTDSGKRGNLLGIGFGLGVLSAGGMFHLVYANGTSDGQPIKLSNSIVHISFNATF